jgi:hypothetical protein
MGPRKVCIILATKADEIPDSEKYRSHNAYNTTMAELHPMQSMQLSAHAPNPNPDLQAHGSQDVPQPST